MESKATNFLLSPNMLSITSIGLNVSNYAQWAQAVEDCLLGRKKFNYLTKDPPPSTDSKYADWSAEDDILEVVCG